MMTRKAILWVRKSKGEDDDVGLTLQREKLPELAEQFVDEYDILDLGVHTGFSIHSRDPDEERIDANPNVLSAVEDLEAGEYDFLIAYNDTRLARDQYFATIERACLIGGAEIRYVEDVDEGMSFELQRTVEKHIKQKEIEQSKKARAHRREKGYWEGRPRFGTKYDEDSAYLIPGEDFVDALRAIKMREKTDEDGNHEYSLRDIAEATDIPLGTLKSILDRREWYLDLESEHSIEA